MMYGWWDGSPAPWYGMIFGPIMMIVFVVLTVLIIAWALRALGLGWQSGTQGRDTPSTPSSTALRAVKSIVRNMRTAEDYYPIPDA